MLTISNIPLSVLNRALDLYNVPRETTLDMANSALVSAEGRKDIAPDFPGISPLAQAVAEYMSGSGPWSEDGGEYEGQNGYRIAM